MTNATISQTAMQAAITELRDACELCLAHKAPHAVGSICTAVANLIAGSGSNGGSAQQRIMDLAHQAGFTPEFYGNGIRVSYFGKDKKTATFGRGQKKSAAHA